VSTKAHIDRLSKGFSVSDHKRMNSAVSFGRQHLQAIKRRTGVSYADHCVDVALTLHEAVQDPDVLMIAVLHDILVHPDGKDLLKQAPLSDNQKDIISTMHELRRLHIHANTEDLDKVIDAFMQEPELLHLRMAHRVSDIRQLPDFTPTLRKQIARETLYMYSAIAGRLGMHRWRSELEDSSFPIVQPKLATQLQEQFRQSSSVDDVCLQHAHRFLQKELQKQGITSSIQNRVKGLYSTYRKMVLKKRDFEALTDRLALRIVVDSLDDCYRTLGIVHAVMHPIPGKLKDYIGAPKENGYQSIHTVVYPLPGVTDFPIEVQIRTQEMHQQCEYGLASHGEYKANTYALHARQSRVNLFRNLDNLRMETQTPKQFEEALRMYFREDHIAIFDAESNLYHFKKPVAAIDIACALYPQKYIRLKSVSINGRARSVDTLLHDGDTIDVSFGRKKTIAPKWGHCALYPSTQKKIRGDLSV